MIVVELREFFKDPKPGRYEVTTRLAWDGEKLETWDIDGRDGNAAGMVAKLTIPRRGPDGERQRVHFADDPEWWLRNLHGEFRAGYLVAVVVRDDDMVELTREDVSARLNMKPDTWSSYVSRGQAPAPARRVGATPVWHAKDIDDWQASRRGRGKRRVMASA